MTSPDERDDAALVAGVLAGDQRAFTQLMRRHKDGLYRFVRGYVGDASEAYDLVQEAFVAAWRALARYDRRRPFGVWLKRIAINKCRDWRRRRAVRQFFYRAEDINRPGLEIAQPIPTGSDHEDELARLDSAIAALPPGLKEPLLLSLTEEMAYREIGETLPEFTLLDQEGRAVAGSRFRGRQIVLNFIFTRCPIATMCPAATERMAALQKAAQAAGAKNFELVSISLDPEYDTPGVLKDYAQLRGLDTSNWSFLTGPDAAVRHLLAQLGVIREFEGATIKHTLATVLINEEGKIAYRVDGSTWPVEDFVRRLRKD